MRTPGSGNKSGFPGDVKSSNLLVECKQTDQKGYRLTSELWKKIYKEALLSNRVPIISLELADGTELVVMSKEDFTSYCTLC